jgi:hypothetical protein
MTCSASFVAICLASAGVLGQDGRERLAAVAPDGTVLAVLDGSASSVTVARDLDVLLQYPDAHIRLTHNHPASTGLSGADLEQLTKPGVDAIEAVGVDGSRYQAARGSHFDPLHFERDQYRPAADEITRNLRGAKASADVLGADAHHAHLTAIALHKAGIIVYRAELSADRASSYERHRALFGRATEAACVRVREADAVR